MTIHLSDAELVDDVDGVLDSERARHLAECPPCRRAVGQLRDALARVVAVDAEEPSPLFWEHFSRRVRGAIDNATVPAGPGWRRWLVPARMRWAGAVALTAAITGTVVWHGGAPAPPARSTSSTGATSSIKRAEMPAPLGPAADQADADHAWALVRTAAGRVDWPEDNPPASAIVGDDPTDRLLDTRPGSVERAALDLTVEERSELTRLLLDEIKRPGA